MLYLRGPKTVSDLGKRDDGGNGNTSNIMFESMQGLYKSQNLRPDQIEEMHDKLSRNLARRGDRN